MQEILKHTLYLGLNDKDTKKQEIATDVAYSLVFDYVLFAKYDGCTITETTGLYTHNNGKKVIEKTLKIEILFATDSQTSHLIKNLKSLFNQETIVLEVATVTSDLI